eukprot:CAMPEP_0168424980 /NCGR_PEP_ID=MMETSP0228-20121227/35094_1 /TAXON_ID=133427 /ORGANISM="Protoceratium reticulatum, Strain CCCM 535 (=CCMP 1889)" /LENGTH=117 /DNA_ID=CAMNT_0008438971 /DNA_START=460 /DNA_END=810 /DNA_ORIENTATION=+
MKVGRLALSTTQRAATAETTKRCHLESSSAGIKVAPLQGLQGASGLVVTVLQRHTSEPAQLWDGLDARGRPLLAAAVAQAEALQQRRRSARVLNYKELAGVIPINDHEAAARGNALS